MSSNESSDGLHFSRNKKRLINGWMDGQRDDVTVTDVTVTIQTFMSLSFFQFVNFEYFSFAFLLHFT